jgi:hypothetical protein
MPSSSSSPSPASAATSLTRAAASSLGLQQTSATERAERARNAARAEALAGQKRARDGRVLARRLEGITRLLAEGGAAIDGEDDVDESDEDDGVREPRQAPPGSDARPGRQQLLADAPMDVEASSSASASGVGNGSARKVGKGRKSKSRETLQEVCVLSTQSFRRVPARKPASSS